MDEITPRELFFNRRAFIRGGVMAATAATTALVYRRLNRIGEDTTQRAAIPHLARAENTTGEELTPRAAIINYNNFYEFTTDKDGVAAAAAGFATAGWTVEVGGLCRKPRTFDLDSFKQLAPIEERIYRHRCVEAWSMVVPWAGFPVKALLDAVEPTSAAKFIAFESLLDPARMPGQKTRVLPWPYLEGLRLDEAMHPLAIFALGLYGEDLPPQDGAPIKLVVPWKYGFKGIKSIVKITLVAEQPRTTWAAQAPAEYGFYANVNPHHDHPRWSQATEQRIGESGRRKTLMFNGYADQVASLYRGMNLDVDF